MDESLKQSILDSLNLLQRLVVSAKQFDENQNAEQLIQSHKKRIQEYGYIADPEYIQKLMNKIKDITPPSSKPN